MWFIASFSNIIKTIWDGENWNMNYRNAAKNKDILSEWHSFFDCTPSLPRHFLILFCQPSPPPFHVMYFLNTFCAVLIILSFFPSNLMHFFSYRFRVFSIYLYVHWLSRRLIVELTSYFVCFKTMMQILVVKFSWFKETLKLNAVLFSEISNFSNILLENFLTNVVS